MYMIKPFFAALCKTLMDLLWRRDVAEKIGLNAVQQKKKLYNKVASFLTYLFDRETMQSSI